MKKTFNIMENNLKIVILAAGQGKRMGNPDLPKVLTPLAGKPMLGYLLDSVIFSGVDSSPVIVIGSMGDKVRQTFGPNNTYVLQPDQLGTGHAVLVAKDELKAATDVMVLLGDHPLVSSELIKNLTQTHFESGEVLTMATVIPPDFESWRSEFKSFGRILRDSQGKITGMAEKKDATGKQLAIKELWPGYMCLKASWLWENLEKVGTDNAQGEYYLTDLVKIAVDQGYSIKTVEIEPKEALGVNTPEQLEIIEKMV